MRAVVYARVSSAIQRDRETIASQLRVLPEYIARQGWTLAAPATTYVDDGRTARAGHLEARLGLAALLRDAGARMFDVVVVVDVDRLTRSEDLAERGAILGALQRAGVKIATSTGQLIDLSTSSGDLMSSLNAFFAAEWVRKHRERIKAGKDTAIARGRKPAGPTPYGLAYDRSSGAWSIDQVTGPIAVEIVTRVADGESCVAISDDLDARGVPGPRGRTTWNRASVYRIVRGRHLIGEFVANKARRQVIAVPRLIDVATFERAQEALGASRRRGLRRTRHDYLLEGLGVCGVCGAPMLIRSATPQRRGRMSPAAYVCRNRKFGRPSIRNGAAACRAPIVVCAEADAAIWSTFIAELAEPELAAAVVAERARGADDGATWAGDAAAAERHLARLEKVETVVMSRFRRGAVSEGALDAELAAIGRERAAVRAQLATAELAIARTVATRVRLEDAESALRRLREVAATAPAPLRAEVLRTFVDRGGVVFERGRLRLAMSVAFAAAPSEERRSGAQLVLVNGPGSRTVDVVPLRVRALAMLSRRACGMCGRELEHDANRRREFCSNVCKHAAWRRVRTAA